MQEQNDSHASIPQRRAERCRRLSPKPDLALTPDGLSRTPGWALSPLYRCYGTAWEPLLCASLVHPLCIWTYNVTDPGPRAPDLPSGLVSHSMECSLALQAASNASGLFRSVRLASSSFAGIAYGFRAGFNSGSRMDHWHTIRRAIRRGCLQRAPSADARRFLRATQQMRGSCSPLDMSRMRWAPMALLSSTRAECWSVTRPIQIGRASCRERV